MKTIFGTSKRIIILINLGIMIILLFLSLISAEDYGYGNLGNNTFGYNSINKTIIGGIFNITNYYNITNISGEGNISWNQSYATTLYRIIDNNTFVGNANFIDNVTILGTLLGGTPVKIYGGLDVQTGNITSNYFVGNGSFLTDVNSTGTNWNSTGLIINWSNVISGTDWNATGLIQNWNISGWIRNQTIAETNWNSTGLIKDWNISSWIINWNATGYIRDWGSFIEVDPKWTANITNYFTKAQWNATNTTYRTDYNKSWVGMLNVSEHINTTGTVYTAINLNLTKAYLWVTNGTFLQTANWNATNNSYLKDYGDTATGNYTIQAGYLFLNGTIGSTPTSGIGTRFMWIPSKSAFRAGYVTSTQWDDENIGAYSTAIGYGTTASGDYSTAMGDSATASGDISTAMGDYTTASGDISTAMGYQTIASGVFSTAMGSSIIVLGQNSVGIGLDNVERTISADNIIAIMGGKVGIGTVTPNSTLHVAGNITITSGNFFIGDGRFLTNVIASETDPKWTLNITNYFTKAQWNATNTSYRVLINNTFSGRVNSTLGYVVNMSSGWTGICRTDLGECPTIVGGIITHCYSCPA